MGLHLYLSHSKSQDMGCIEEHPLIYVRFPSNFPPLSSSSWSNHTFYCKSQNLKIKIVMTLTLGLEFRTKSKTKIKLWLNKRIWNIWTHKLEGVWRLNGKTFKLLPNHNSHYWSATPKKSQFFKNGIWKSQYFQMKWHLNHWKGFNANYNIMSLW